MIISARPAQHSDLPVLLYLYRELEAEMQPLSDMWTPADALPEPVEAALAKDLDDAYVFLGEIDGYPFGFMIVRIEDLLPQADGMRVAAIRFVFVEPDARGVGVGEALRDLALETLRDRGISRFDAHVLPGHRLVKNFFEQGGFSARSIVMHRSE